MALPACFVAAMPLPILKSHLYVQLSSVRAKGAMSVPQTILLFAVPLVFSLYPLVTYSTAELSIQLTHSLARLPSTLSSRRHSYQDFFHTEPSPPEDNR